MIAALYRLIFCKEGLSLVLPPSLPCCAYVISAGACACLRNGLIRNAKTNITLHVLC